ncbi:MULTISPECIES: DUF2780 domain-containing protein [Pseudomonas]|uniref:DUF2780 domain-containing protein n=1 Tax=Pseudomonas lundensis TaxID=86185 RepID=A0AAP6YT85_9PSED|nr:MULTISPECIES: DUF2780 domain-containing protein [Pseudomonas]AOZ12609.1 hypothetical protein AA042_08045 [Pseudomonas lundensis]MBS5839146.1 DUF2780 domain-containing protein [Pseudomonas sp.]MCT8952413.1 DUF2780 domain-containing protein [Pseudomonas lundensis]NLU00439.1 DUF2780 domain-containing protein [Pseudomonas lundensis]NMZ56058.1 DUF2780 domain-containing protein [Pseudomonas lundensis]
MKKLSAVALATWMTVAASPVFAGGFSLNDAAGILNQVQGGNSAKSDQTVQALALLNKAQQMGVKPEQAAGGVGAMLSLAKNQLTTNDYAALTQQVPGINKVTGAGALTQLSQFSAKNPQLQALVGQINPVSKDAKVAVSNVTNQSQLNSAFEALGMNSSLIQEFAPLITQYLGQQGVASPLLTTLSTLWGA